MLRLALTGLGFAAALGAGVVVVPSFFASDKTVEVASLDPSAGLEEAHQSHERSAFSKVVGILPFIGDDEPPLTRARALADRDALRARKLNSFTPEAPEGWEKLEWDMFFTGKFGEPDRGDEVADEVVVYLKGGKAIYLRIEHATPSGPMVADLLQIQRYVEKGGDLSDLEAYRETVDHTIEAVRTTADGWSIGPNMRFGYFEIVSGVSFIVGKVDVRPNDYPDLRFYHGALGGGIVIKIRSDAPSADVLAVLEGIDFDGLNQRQDVPHPLVGEGLPELVIETPEQWLHNRGFKLRKVERVIPVKEEPQEPEEGEELAEADEDVIAKGGDKDKKNDEKGH